MKNKILNISGEKLELEDFIQIGNTKLQSKTIKKNRINISSITIIYSLIFTLWMMYIVEFFYTYLTSDNHVNVLPILIILLIITVPFTLRYLGSMLFILTGKENKLESIFMRGKRGTKQYEILYKKYNRNNASNQLSTIFCSEYMIGYRNNNRQKMYVYDINAIYWVGDVIMVKIGSFITMFASTKNIDENLRNDLYELFNYFKDSRVIDKIVIEKREDMSTLQYIVQSV